MAVTKIKPIKSTLSKALAYIQNPAKTEEKMLVSSFGCSYETADIEFAYTLSQALEKGNNLAHHLMQSFEPGEVSYEKAHEIGRQLADAVTKGQYEYVLTTHIDKGHIHNHVIFCAVNFIDHRKYNSNKRSYYGIRNISDRLCRENGLSVVVPGRGSKGKSYAEYQAEKTGTSWKGKLKIAVDALIPQASDFADFLRLLQAAGYEIKPGKYISCRAPGQERFTRLKILGADYTEEAITERIKGRRTRAAKAPKQERGGISLVIDIQNSIKAQESRGYEHWAKIHNLKQAARTLNFLTENRIDSYAELSAKIAEVNAASEQAAGALKGVERRLADMAVLINGIVVSTTICVCRCRNTTSTRQSLWIATGIITWRKVMAKLTKYEKETIILFNEGEDTASIYTYNASLRKRLALFSKKHPDLCRLEKSHEQGGVTYLLDKSRLSIRLQPPYSEERRRKASENAKQNGFNSQME